MSSHGYADERPAEMVVCSSCGATNDTRRSYCWLCNEALDGHDTSTKPVGYGSAGEQDELRQQIHSVSSVVIVLALIGVCVGLALSAPGLCVLIASVALPALLRTLYVTKRQRKRSNASFLETFMHSIAVVTATIVIVAVGAVAAFFVACIAMITGSTPFKWFVQGFVPTEILLLGAVGLSVVVTIVLVYKYNGS